MTDEKTDNLERANAGQTCLVCPHECRIPKGRAGLCGARVNKGGKIVCGNYGKVTSIALDPIEKKPLLRFRPGSMILSVGSYGCNLRCPFCQNYEISMQGEDQFEKDTSELKKMAEAGYDRAREALETRELAPSQLLKIAISLKKYGNCGIAFTYNEPTIGYEFVLDTSKLFKENGMATVVVTNGCLNEKPWREVCSVTDAMNIDLKVFSDEGYKKLSGDFEIVKKNIRIAYETGVHVEVTTLIVPFLSDRQDDMESEACFLADIDPLLPLHISRFFPRYKATSLNSTNIDLMRVLADIARKHLRYVYLGNC